MRYVTVPETISVRFATSGPAEPFPFLRLLGDEWLNDLRFANQGPGWMRTGARVEELFAKTIAGAVVQVEQADWERVRDAINAPTPGSPHHPAIVLRQLAPYFDAFLEASESPPSPPP